MSYIQVVVFIGIMILFIVIVFSALKRIQTQRLQSMQARFPNAVLTKVSFYGQQSKGVIQMRGNGLLALTSEALVFELLVPQHELQIPLQQIQSIETPSSFLGKSRFRPLLKVNFINEAGNLDAAAWELPNLAEFKQKLEARLA